MADAYAISANALHAIVTAEFAAENPTIEHDELHESLGTDDNIPGPVIGIAPDRQVPAAGNRAAMQTILHIQFFDAWDKEIDPTQLVDPRIITGYHKRLLNAIRLATVTVSGDMWFFQWEGTEYPRDPTGNKSRFVMSLRVWSNNSELVETGA